MCDLWGWIVGEEQRWGETSLFSPAALIKPWTSVFGTKHHDNSSTFLGAPSSLLWFSPAYHVFTIIKQEICFLFLLSGAKLWITDEGRRGQCRTSGSTYCLAANWCNKWTEIWSINAARTLEFQHRGKFWHVLWSTLNGSLGYSCSPEDETSLILWPFIKHHQQVRIQTISCSNIFLHPRRSNWPCDLSETFTSTPKSQVLIIRLITFTYEKRVYWQQAGLNEQI